MMPMMNGVAKMPFFAQLFRESGVYNFAQLFCESRVYNACSI
jgi:hypothetical protein